MTCQECEQAIYLYDELTAVEKAAVDQHVSKCTACRVLADQVSASRQLIAHMAAVKPQPENFSRLTSSIMQAVEAQKLQTVPEMWLGKLFIKYALGAASVLLVVFFVLEQQPANVTVQQSATVKTVTLKSSSFLRKRVEEKKEEPFSLYACVHSDGCDKTIIENFKQRR